MKSKFLSILTYALSKAGVGRNTGLGGDGCEAKPDISRKEMFQILKEYEKKFVFDQKLNGVTHEAEYNVEMGGNVRRFLEDESRQSFRKSLSNQMVDEWPFFKQFLKNTGGGYIFSPQLVIFGSRKDVSWKQTVKGIQKSNKEILREDIVQAAKIVLGRSKDYRERPKVDV